MLNIVEYRRNEFEVFNEDLYPTFREFIVTRLWFSPLIISLGILLIVFGVLESGLYFLFTVGGVILLITGLRGDPVNLLKQEIYDRTRYYGFKLTFNTEKEFEKMVAYRIIDPLTGEMKETDVNTKQAVGYRIVAVVWEYRKSLPFGGPLARKIEEINRDSVVELGYQIELVYSETQPGIPLIELSDLEETCELIHVFDEIFPNKTFFPPQEKVYSDEEKVSYSPLNNDFVQEINELINETDFPDPFRSYFKRFVYMD